MIWSVALENDNCRPIMVSSTDLFFYLSSNTFIHTLSILSIDKIFSFVVGGKDISGKKCVLIACCAENDMSVFDGVRIPYERIASLCKWHSVGEVLISGVLNIGDIDKTDGCLKATALAKQF